MIPKEKKLRGNKIHENEFISFKLKPKYQIYLYKIFIKISSRNFLTNFD